MVERLLYFPPESSDKSTQEMFTTTSGSAYTTPNTTPIKKGKRTTDEAPLAPIRVALVKRPRTDGAGYVSDFEFDQE